jgi:hypothetical protein
VQDLTRDVTEHVDKVVVWLLLLGLKVISDETHVPLICLALLFAEQLDIPDLDVAESLFHCELNHPNKFAFANPLMLLSELFELLEHL